MVAYLCKKCGRFTVFGYVNKYNEHFCTMYCYEKYCKRNNYEFKTEDVKEIYKC